MISILGGSGFVGSAVIKYLEDEKYNFHCYDKKPSHLDIPQTYFDITNFNLNNYFHNSNTILNLAAVHRDDVRPKSLYHDVNVEGAKKVCSSATLSGVNQIIFTSSVAIYGFAPPNTGEDGEANYFNEYGKTKFLAEQVYLDWQKEDPENRSLVIIRPTVIFGPGNRGNVFNLLNQIASNKFAMFGSGKNVKSMAYVENVAAFIVHSLKFGSGVHIYNYIDKPDLNMNNLVSKTKSILYGKEEVGLRLPAFVGIAIGWLFDICSVVLRRPLAISSLRVKKFMATTQFSTAIENTNFIAPFDLVDGLKKTLQYEFIEDNSDKQTFETE